MNKPAKNQQLYTSLQQAGFVLVFKPVLQVKERGAKGHVNADLVLKAMTEYGNYEKAVIVTSDGDFCSLVETLRGTFVCRPGLQRRAPADAAAKPGLEHVSQRSKRLGARLLQARLGGPAEA